MSDHPLSPSAALLCKLGSIIVHADEGTEDGAHFFDLHTVRTLLADPEVKAWLAAMDRMAMLPVKRSAR